MNNKSIKVAIIDDEMLFRKSVVYLLNGEENIDVVYDGNNGMELLKYLNHSADLPDIILVDIRMPILDGVETSKILNEQFPGIKIIVLTSFDTHRFIDQMIQFGASSYMIKSFSPEKVIETINKVYQEGIFFDSIVMNSIVAMKRNESTNEKVQVRLSEREIEILKLVKEQYSTKEIADKLFKSERTIEGHRKNMLEKTKSRNVVGLIIWGIKNNIIEI